MDRDQHPCTVEDWDGPTLPATPHIFSREKTRPGPWKEALEEVDTPADPVQPVTTAAP